MAAFSGKQGKITFDGGATANVVSWSIEATADVADVTAMSSLAYTSATHWKEYAAGFLDWTATVECEAESTGLDPNLDGDFAQDADGKTLVLYSGMVAIDQQEGSVARKYTGNAIITSVVATVDKNDVARLTYTFQGSGTLTEAASDAT